jgi:hypothetical protein
LLGLKYTGQYQNIFDPSKYPHFAEKLSAAYLEIIEQCMKFRKVLLGQKISLFRRLTQPLSSSLRSDLDQAVDNVRERRKAVEKEAHICHMIEAKQTQELVVRNDLLRRAKEKGSPESILLLYVTDLTYDEAQR